MKSFEERIEVSLPHGKSYPILIGTGCLERMGALLREHSVQGEVFLLSDKTVWKLYGQRLQHGLNDAGIPLLERFLIDPGEQSKSLETWGAVLDRMVSLEDGSVRRVVLLILGGGVVGDLGGFVAAAYRRGIPFIQVPTTLLAQVDSSVGGKTGVNHPGGKNLIGAFHQPDLVVIDLATLETLPERQVRAGLMEVIKYGLIWDASFFEFLEKNHLRILSLDPEPLAFAVKRSCEIKADVVGQDEKESKGVRTLLNFGHTFGHAIEAATDYTRFMHGEAVGMGMLCAAWLSVSLGMLPRKDLDRIKALVQGSGLRMQAQGVDPARLLEAMKRDKKFIHGRNRFVLLEEIGRAQVREDVDPALISQALELLFESPNP